MKKLIALLLASSFVGCSPQSKNQSAPPEEARQQAQPATPLASVPANLNAADYYATFEGNDLGCCIVRDKFHKPPQALAEGRSNVGETADWITKDAKLGMVLKAPMPIAANTTPSMGIFSVGHDFGPQSTLTISATFQKPVGAPSGKAWAVGVVGRTGGVDDTADLKRIVLSFRTCTTGLGPCAGAKANLRVFEVESADPDDPATVRLANVNIPDDVFDAIFTSGQPFTLKLFIDRKKGSGIATITTGTATIPPLMFNLTIFTGAADAPIITTVGATLANGFAQGETVAVEVNDFAVWAR